MRLIIHAGTHRTATTTFQEILDVCRGMLVEGGVMYPQIYNWPQHSFLAWMLQRSNREGSANILESCLSQARSAQCNTVLLSGEDFENFLINVDAARQFQMLAQNIGFSSVEWLFVARNPVEYLLSLYSTMSAHRVVLNLDEMAESVGRRGFFSVSNSSYSYHFVFAVVVFAERLAEDTSCRVQVMEFRDFTADYPGRCLLDRLISSGDLMSRIDLAARDIQPRNTRRTVREVEWGYALTALGISRADEQVVQENRELIEAVTQVRERRYLRLHTDVGCLVAHIRWY